MDSSVPELHPAIIQSDLLLPITDPVPKYTALNASIS